jgi:hypothetical protein
VCAVRRDGAAARPHAVAAAGRRSPGTPDRLADLRRGRQRTRRRPRPGPGPPRREAVQHHAHPVRRQSGRLRTRGRRRAGGARR